MSVASAKTRRPLWLISHYSGLPAESNPQKRQFFIAKYLSANRPVTCFFSRYDYFTAKHRACSQNFPSERGMSIKLVANPVTYRRNDWRRLANAFTYALNVFFTCLFVFPRPEWIYVSVPSNFAAISAYMLSRIMRTKLAYEVFDIWSLTFVYLHGKPREYFVVKALLALDRFMVKKADLVVSPLRKFDKYCKEYLGVEIHNKFVFLYQGYEDDLGSSIRQAANPRSLHAENIRCWISCSREAGKKIFVYAGTIGSSNNIKAICLHVARLGQLRQDFVVLFIGRGDLMNSIPDWLGADMAARHALFPPVDYADLLDILKLCDIALNSHPDVGLYDYGLASLKTIDYIKTSLPVAYVGHEPMIDELGIGFCSSTKEEFVCLADRLLSDESFFHRCKEANNRAGKMFRWNSLIAVLSNAIGKRD